MTVSKKMMGIKIIFQAGVDNRGSKNETVLLPT